MAVAGWNTLIPGHLQSDDITVLPSDSILQTDDKLGMLDNARPFCFANVKYLKLAA